MEDYSLPELPYGYGELEPYMSEEQLRVHHDKHHKAYVDGANAIIKKLADARKSGEMPDMKSALKSLSWNVGGHVLHSLFWKNLAPKGGKMGGALAEAIKKEFGSEERFKAEFNETAKSIEGSGWAALAFCRKSKRMFLMQIEKHNTNMYPGFEIIMVLDMFEHAYYIDHRNDKAKFIENFWKIVNWEEVGRRFEG
ncbi:superoxide dismutase [Candidatus Woesearchaeota archaeon]|nr:superoxide dismutase [Candidatus Woesearchaeota archaeon]